MSKSINVKAKKKTKEKTRGEILMEKFETYVAEYEKLAKEWNKPRFPIYKFFAQVHITNKMHKLTAEYKKFLDNR